VNTLQSILQALPSPSDVLAESLTLDISHSPVSASSLQGPSPQSPVSVQHTQQL